MSSMTPADEPGDDAAPSDAAAPPATATPPAAPPRHRAIVSFVVVVLLAVLGAVVLRVFVFESFYIPSDSMVPTLQMGDRIIVNKLSYDLHGVHRGDIIVFHPPPAETATLEPYLVKRVIGLPGETISGRGGNVYINGKLLNEPWLPGANTSPFPPVKVPPGDYFVMGDNRDASYDSRSWGPLPGNLIVGRVIVLIWPLSRFHIFWS
jgi:signal peptidase I